jgi:segregation and condensation protein B
MIEREGVQAPPAGELPWVIESLLFVAGEPQSASALAKTLGVGEGAVKKAIAQLRADYEARGLQVQDDNGRYQLVTRPEYGPYVQAFLGAEAEQKLSRAALETLTIIAYRQPCTRGEIEAIRGANSDRLVATLEQRGLIESAGTADGPGRPRLYRTTSRFFAHFGIRSRDDLPPLPQPEELAEAEI